MCQLPCVFSFFTSHLTCQILNCACQFTCIFCVCKFFHVQCQKRNKKTLSKTHTTWFQSIIIQNYVHNFVTQLSILSPSRFVTKWHSYIGWHSILCGYYIWAPIHMKKERLLHITQGRWVLSVSFSYSYLYI